MRQCHRARSTSHAKYFDRRHKAAILTAAACTSGCCCFWRRRSVRGKRFEPPGYRKGIGGRKARGGRGEEMFPTRQNVECRRRPPSSVDENLYVANMQLAAQIWNRPDGNQRQDRRTVGSMDSGGRYQPDLREFTWRHQWSSASPELEANRFYDQAAPRFRKMDQLDHGKRRRSSNLERIGPTDWSPLRRRCLKRVVVLRWTVGRASPKRTSFNSSMCHRARSRTKIPGEQFSLSSNNQFLASWQSEGEISVWDITSETTETRLIHSDQPVLSMTPETGTSALVRGREVFFGPRLSHRSKLGRSISATYLALAGKPDPVIFHEYLAHRELGLVSRWKS